MAKIETIEEIKKKYHNEWVLIEVKEFDNRYNIISGEVLVHSPSKSEIYQNLLKYKDKQLAIEYIGKIPYKMAVLL